MLLVATDLSCREGECFSNSELTCGTTAWCLLPFYMHSAAWYSIHPNKFSYLV